MKSIKMFGKSVPLLAIVVISLLAVGAGAVLLTTYTTVTWNPTVVQSVTIDYDTVDFDNPTAGNTYCFQRVISNAAEINAEIELVTTPPTGVTVTYRDTLLLTQKEDFGTPGTGWTPVDNGMEATICYTATGLNFDYRIDAVRLDTDTDYVLIYYADQPDRFVVWGGAPAFELGRFTSDEIGEISTSGSADPGTMPYLNDWNRVPPADYTQPPDNYDHATGAKLWLIPLDCYNGGDVVVTWAPERFLFETDLITYFDGVADNTRTVPAEGSLVTHICYQFLLTHPAEPCTIVTSINPLP